MNTKNLKRYYFIIPWICNIILIFFHLFLPEINQLKVSIIDYSKIKAPSFNGVVLPIEHVPNYLLIDKHDRNKTYTELDSSNFIPTPKYNYKILKRDINNLPSNSELFKETLSHRIIYTALYLGTYKFDYIENNGSHPGIDIKAPLGTPIKSVANGVIVKIGKKLTGFGNFVYIKHENILFGGKKQNLYSLYAHMDKVYKKPGDIVMKGDKIGTVGNSGVSTSSHLHFQIDREEAPFRPYWHFTDKQIKMLGISLFEGVNKGLGKENVIKYTVNPTKILFSEETQNEEELNLSVAKNTKEETSKNDGNPINKKKEKIENKVKTKEEVAYVGNINKIYTNKEKKSTKFKKHKLRSRDKIFIDVYSDYKYFDAIKFLSDNKILSGFSDKTFRPEEKINRSEASKMILRFLEISPSTEKKSYFDDVDNISWYKKYVNKFVELEVISRNNKNFYPLKNITRIEGIKLVAKIKNIDLTKFKTKNFFKDIEKGNWRNKYSLLAKEMSLVEYDKNFYPDKSLTRGELANIVYILRRL